MTTIQYTKQWVRIAGSLRPTNYLLAIAAASLLLGVALLVTERSFVLAAEVFFLTLVLTSALTALIWRRARHTEINLGAALIRSGKRTIPFAQVSGLELHVGNLLLTTTGAKILLPLPWLSRDQLIVIERMVGMLSPTQVSAVELDLVRGHLLTLLATD